MTKSNFPEENLKLALFRHQCPSHMLLGEYQLGVLTKPQQAVLATHLNQCPHCQQDLAAIQAALAQPFPQEDRPSNSTETPVSVPQRAKQFVINLLSPPADTLIAPSRQLAWRGDDEALKTQLFQVEQFIIALSFQKDISHLDKYMLIADISMAAEAAVAVDFEQWKAFLWQNNTLLTVSILDEDGYFSFDGLVAGERPFELILSGPEIEVYLQNIQLPFAE